uniref:Uncharacterized protein n=1 Tax=Peromyscus maniculatus bairdii TaxID=230844 RepID=A0A8C8USE0_PERMB
MSESSSKFRRPLASKQEKDGTEKRGLPVSPGTALVGSPVEYQHRGDLRTHQREAKVRVLPRRGKLPQLQGGNQGADPRNWRRRKRRAFPRSPQRKSSDHAQCHLLLGHQRSSFPLGLEAPLPGPSHPHCTGPHQLQALWLPQEQDLAQSLSPPPQHTCPLLTGVTSHLGAACPDAHLP